MNILEENLKALKKKNPKLAETIENKTSLENYFAIDEAKTGDSVLIKNNHSIHSLIDPEEEAIELFEKIKNKSTAINILYGLGLGYILKRFKKSAKGDIILFEPDIEVLRIGFELVDFTEEINAENIYFASTIKEIEDIYKKIFFINHELNFVVNSYYPNYEKESFSVDAEEISKIQGIYQSNYTVFMTKDYNWNISGINNFKKIIKYDELLSIKDKFKNKPAIIISAGPSLDKNIHLVKKNRDKFVVICVGTSLKKTIENGIIPDFLCILEYIPETMNHVKNIDTKDMNIVLQPISYTGLYDLPAENKFIFWANNDSTSKWLGNLFGIDVSPYINLGTVSINAFMTAKIIGANPIILIGQDLAYTNGCCYAKGTVYEDLQLTVKDGKYKVELSPDSSKKEDEETKARIEKLTSQLYMVKSQTGELIPSMADYIMFIKYFEELGARYKNENILINATEGGAYIENYNYMTLSEAIEKYCQTAFSHDFEVKENKEKEKRAKKLNEILNNAVNIYTNETLPILEKGKEIALEYRKVEDKSTINREILQELLLLYKQFKISIIKNSFLTFISTKGTLAVDFYIKRFDNTNEEITQILYQYLDDLFVDERWRYNKYIEAVKQG